MKFWLDNLLSNKSVSQTRAVVKNEIFWWATGQSNLSYRRLTTTKTSKVQFSYSHTCTLTNEAVFHSVCQVWLPSGPPGYFIFSYCARLWNWLKKIPCIIFFLCLCSRDKSGPLSSCLDLFWCIHCFCCLIKSS